VNITPLPFSSARGAPLQNPPGSGIQNFDVSLAIALERDKARRLAFNTTFPAQGLSDHHHYIAWSLAVRRLILLETFGIPYLGGVWSLDFNGMVTNTASGIPVPIAVNRELVVQEHTSGSIQMSKEPDPPFNSILTMQRLGTGAIEGRGWEVSLNPCSILGNGSTVTTPTTNDTITLGLTGVYDCDTNEQFWDGNFAGSASGRLLIKVEEPLLPGAPSGYSYSVAGSTVSLRWLAPSTGGAPLSYRILAGLVPGDGQVNLSTGNTATSFVVPGVPPGTYYTRVVAENAQGTSPPSNEIAVVVTPPGVPLPPGPPANYSAVVNGSTVILNWLAPATGGPPSSYRILAGLAPGGSEVDFNTGNTALSLAVPQVPPGTYFTRIVAVNAGGTSAPSNEIMVVVR
jgi:hypothetical protein